MCVSMVLGLMRLWMVAGWVCPMRWMRAQVWWYLAGVQGASMKSRLFAVVRVCPCAAASIEMMMFFVFGLFWNWCFAFSVSFGVWPPMIVGALSSFARVCTMWRWWAAMTIFCPELFAFSIHSRAWGILLVATIFLSSVICMRVS